MTIFTVNYEKQNTRDSIYFKFIQNICFELQYIQKE